MCKKFCLYSRQSKESGIVGQMTLATSEHTIQLYLDSVGVEGVDYVIVGHFEEVKSSYGKNSRNREEFNKALEICYADKSVSLVVSNISRLSRNNAHGAAILEDLNVILASNPTATDTFKNLLLVLSQDESAQQSLRRRATCEAKRARCKESGEKFVWGGNSEKWRETFNRNRLLGNHKKPSPSAKTIASNKLAINELKKLISYSNDQFTLSTLAEKINSQGLRTSRGNPWSDVGVKRLLDKNNIPYKKKNKHLTMG